LVFAQFRFFYHMGDADFLGLDEEQAMAYSNRLPEILRLNAEINGAPILKGIIAVLSAR
jgi:hypothetical protein